MMAEAPLTIAVLISGSGTTLINLVEQIEAGKLNARISIVIASKSDCAGIPPARKAGLPCVVVERRAEADAETFGQHVFCLCEAADAELVCMGGWLCMTPVPKRWNGRVMNIHPSLLPSFGGKGMYGHKVHEAVLNHGCKVSGCTVHFVDDSCDNGPIILQRSCPVLDTDTPQTLAARVFAEEKLVYPEAIRLFHRKQLATDGRRVHVKA